MAWLPFALASPALLTVVNFVDKYIVEHEVRDHRAMPIFAGIAGLLAAAIFWLLGWGTPLPPNEALIVVLTGALIIVGAAFYFRAIASEQASTIILLYQLTPVIVLLFGWLLLDETITLTQLIGFCLILTAGMGLAVQPGAGRLRLSLAAILTLAASVTIAIRSIMMRTISSDPNFTTLVIYQGIGQGIGAILLYLFGSPFRGAFNRSLPQISKKALLILWANESLSLVAVALVSQALTLGPAALVNVLEGTRAFYGILLGWLLTRIAPAIFQENIESRALTRKVILAGMLFVGLAFVVFSNAA